MSLSSSRHRPRNRFRRLRARWRQWTGLSVLLAIAGVVPRGTSLYPVPPVPREFRAAWLTPISDLQIRDWPSAPGLSPDSQRAELRFQFDRAQAIGLNAVVLHVRIAADAMYPTRYAPWSTFLTGASGVGPQPAYDPLAYAIAEAHARGLQLHAWFNPFRAMYPGVAGSPAASHVTRTHPSWIRRYGSQTWIDPGEPGARAAIIETILDVVRRYDVDGVHIDDYFYPYREQQTITRRVRRKRVRVRQDIPFPDDKTWKLYGRAKGWTDRDAWRRSNIDAFVETLYRDVKRIKPAVLVGISPFGIWRSGTPRGITGLDAFDEIYADARRWLAEGWVDYLAPQLYWPMNGEQNRFRVLDDWWRTQNPRGRHVWPGLYTSRTWSPRAGWSMSEVAAQITTLREHRAGSDDAPGHIHFRLGALIADQDALGSSLASGAYADRALVPAAPWLGDGQPAAPVINVIGSDGATSFTVTPGDSMTVRWWLVQAHGRAHRWTTTIQPAASGTLSAGAFGTDDPDEIAVRAVSPTGVVGPPSIVVP
jgi:uncharacterized lipoprotein YddW (UPF0748 family)